MPLPKSVNKPKKSKEVREPAAARAFKRVKEEAIEWHNEDDRVKNNSYATAFGTGGWAGTAAAHLAKVKGKDFRHEKTKKKRGTYKGSAEIDIHAVNSVRLDNSSD